MERKTRRLALCVAMAGGVCAAAAAKADATLYTISNGAAGNTVAVIKQTDDGGLRVVGRYATGGVGSGVGIAVPADPLGTQFAVILSDDRRWLIVPNAASNTISVFRVLGDALVLASVTPAGADYPAGFALRNNNRLYVLDSAGRTRITQFVLLPNGRLLPQPDRSVDFPTVSASVGTQPNVLDSPGQIQFSPDGRWLVATDKNFVAGRGGIAVYPVDHEGRLGTPTLTTLDEPAPFGFTFDAQGRLLVTLPVTGSLGRYAIGSSGALTQVSLISSQQMTPCWIDGRAPYYYSTNTFSDSISAYAAAADGSLRLLNADGVAVALGTGAQPTEVHVSRDGRRLFVVASGSGKLEMFSIEPKTGALSTRRSLQVFDGFTGMSGLALR